MEIFESWENQIWWLTWLNNVAKKESSIKLLRENINNFNLFVINQWRWFFKPLLFKIQSLVNLKKMKISLYAKFVYSKW